MNNEAQLIDDEDLERGVNEDTEPRRLGELVDDIIAENNNAPATESHVKPVAMTMTNVACTRRRFPDDPLEFLSPLSLSPPEFVPSFRLSQEMKDTSGLSTEIMWLEEGTLAAKIFRDACR